jgi:hypothetical protein
MKTIDMTPTWQGLLPMLLALYTDSDAKGRAYALSELQRMAKICDLAVSESEEREEQLAKLTKQKKKRAI